MKRILWLLLFALLPTLIYAQDLQTQARHYLSGLGVSNGEITRIVDIQTNTRTQVREAQLELNVLKAQLDQALFPMNVDMNKVQKLLDRSLGLKMKAELARIRERVEIRKILGDYKYAAYQRFMHNAARRQNGRYRRPNVGQNRS